jgi:5'-3' exonuclease
MGILQFADLFVNDNTSSSIRFEDLRNTNIALDVSITLMAAINTKRELRGPDGLITNHIKVVLDIITAFAKIGVISIWIFDPDKHIVSKSAVQKKRIESTKDKHDAKLVEFKSKQLEYTKAVEFINNNNIDEKMKKELLDQTNSNFGPYLESKKMYDDVGNINIFKIAKMDIKKIFDALNIPYIVAPNGIEAEQLCALLAKSGVCKYVYSKDMDSLVFGAPMVIYKIPKTQKYIKIERSKILIDKKIDDDKFIKSCVTLGCDFANKVPRVGYKTVLSKVSDIKFDAEQTAAISLFKNDNITPEIKANLRITLQGIVEKIKKGQSGVNDYVNLRSWLAVHKGFVVKLKVLDDLYL